MKKQCILFFALLVSVATLAQPERNLKLNEDTNLIEVTFYHDNGVVSQTGFYTLDGELHGEWLRFDTEGKKLVLANYDNGKKVGKWFYWNNTTLKEVDYSNNVITNVNEWDSKSSVAIRN